MDWFLYDNDLRHERVKSHKPFPLDEASVLAKENKIGKWSEDMACRISVSLISFCKVFQTKKNLIFSVENDDLQKVNFFSFVFLIF